MKVGEAAAGIPCERDMRPVLLLLVHFDDLALEPARKEYVSVHCSHMG